MPPPCEICKEQPTGCFSSCDKCDVGICEKCNWRLGEAYMEQLKQNRSSCQYCGLSYEDACSTCCEYYENIRDNASRHGYDQTWKQVHPNGCDCDPRCTCRQDAELIAWKDYQWLTPVWEFYNVDTDHTELKCKKCLTKQDRRHLRNMLIPKGKIAFEVHEKLSLFK